MRPPQSNRCPQGYKSLYRNYSVKESPQRKHDGDGLELTFPIWKRSAVLHR